MVDATLMSDAATGCGLIAGAIAVCGFIAHARLALGRADEQRLRRATTLGGLAGICLSAFIIVLSAIGKVAS
jgi:hypothetical protein